MRKELLVSSISRVEWSKTLHKNLVSDFESYLNSKPIGIAVGQSNQSAPIEVFFRVHRYPPEAKWGLMVGDIAHNLRAALDNLACVIVSPYGRCPDVNFPIVQHSNDLETRIEDDLMGVPDQVKTFIREISPCGNTNAHFYQLSRLNNEDKHRSLTAGKLIIEDVNLDVEARIARVRPPLLKGLVWPQRKIEPEWKDGQLLVRFIPENCTIYPSMSGIETTASLSMRLAHPVEVAGLDILGLLEIQIKAVEEIIFKAQALEI